MKYIIGIIAFLMLIHPVYSQERQEVINKELSFSAQAGGTLWIDNINGKIKVDGYSGNSVTIQANKKISAGSPADLEKYWNQFKLITKNSGDTIEVYVDGLCNCDCNHRHPEHWSEGKNDIDFSFDFTVKVPFNTNLLLSTVNNGDITVDHVKGTLNINNVNGGIFMNEVSGTTSVNTINGDVSIKYSENPANDSKYYTLNGKLSVYYLPELSADMSFKSFNGEFYTNFNISGTGQSGIISNISESNTTTYKVDEKTSVTVGKGGIKLDFETFNGDIFIRKKENQGKN